MKKNVLFTSLLLLINIIVIAQNGVFYGSPSVAFPEEFTFTGSPLIYNDIYSSIDGSSSQMSFQVFDEDPSSKYQVNYSNSFYNASLTIVGTGRFQISHLVPGTAASIGTRLHPITVKDGLFTFTEKPEAIVSFSGINLVYNLVTTSTSASIVYFRIEDLSNSREMKEVSKVSKGDLPLNKNYSLSDNSLTISGVGSFTLIATQNDIAYRYAFEVISTSGVSTSTTNFEQSDFSISPNPSSGTFTINTDVKFDLENTRLFDVYGRNVSFELANKQLKVNEKGIYFLRINNRSFKLKVE